MLQREVVRQALERRRATHGNTPQFQRAEEFIQSALECTGDCWDELAVKFRNNYYDVMDEIVAIIKDTDDPLILFHLLRQADLKEPAELESVRKIVRDINPDKHEVSMLGLTGEPTLRAALKKRSGLPESVRTALAPPAEEAVEEAAPAEEKSSTKSSKGGRTSKKAGSE